jgi:serpin B
MSIWSIAAAALLAMATLDARHPPPQARKVSASALALSSANNEFGFDLLHKLHRNGDNTFLSPTSIGMALQMASRGASGATLAEMQKAMHAGGFDVAAANRELIPSLATRDSVKLNIGNSVWVDPARLVLDTAFAAGVGADFRGEIIARDFRDPATVGAVNAWISDKTAGKIPRMLSQLKADTVMLIVNAIYFKGEWTRKFDKTRTREADFHLAGGATKRLPMMEDTSEYRYAESPDLQLVALPFGKDANVEMWIALPRSATALDAFVRGLDETSWNSRRQRASSRPGTVRIPRFTVRFKSSLNDSLGALGMKLAFTTDADFGKFGRSPIGPVYVSEVLHEAVIEANEEGAEAAAATVVSTLAESIPPPPFEMTCDRPFLLMITDSVTGSVLFVGTVYNPS